MPPLCEKEIMYNMCIVAIKAVLEQTGSKNPGRRREKQKGA